MKDNRRTQAERSAVTRQALVSAARALFAARGFSDVGTEEIVREAGVSRGALYHHFADKTELFAAAFEAVEAEAIARIGARIAGAGLTDPIAVMRLAASAWLDACAEPDVHRIALIDGPAVLGHARWREIGDRFGLRVTSDLLTHAIEAGRAPEQPVAPLAHVILGALREGALYLAAAQDWARARREVGAVVDRLIGSLETASADPADTD
jgi:AcrR family transcriptional regulator